MIRFIRKKKIEPLYTFGCNSFFRTSLNVSSIFTGLAEFAHSAMSYFNNFEFCNIPSTFSRIPVIESKFFHLRSLSFHDNSKIIS